MTQSRLIPSHVLEILRCTSCDHDALVLGHQRRPNVVCPECQTAFPLRDGILDMTPPEKTHRPGGYRSATFSNWIAGFYDLSAPMMSAAIWNCSPLRYIDHTHRALGRANGGILLTMPIATGSVLNYALANYHDVTIVGIDPSRNMLKRAAKRFRDTDHEIVLIQAEPDRLPIKNDAVDAVQSLNGLHTFDDRTSVVSEWLRVSKPGAYVSGATIVRGQEFIADTVLDRYEQYGLFPMLRTAEYLFEEMHRQGFANVRFETHGAVAFFAASSTDPAKAKPKLTRVV